MDDISQEDHLIAQFASIASVPNSEARQYLAANNWDISSALTEFYTAKEEDDPEHEHDDHLAEYDDDEEPEEEPVLPGGGRRLGDGPTNPRPQPIPTSSSTQRKKKEAAPKKRFATLGDVSGDTQALEDEDDDDDTKQDLFAGGEKSGLAVQNPDDIKRKILEKAIKTGRPVAKEEPKPRSSHFTGSARTLGGDDTPSRTIEPPPQPRVPPTRERVNRVLHFWNDGFSVDDGDLYRTDDPHNAEILNGIRQGRAPLSIMNVRPGQEVDVEIKQHQENYVRPKKKYVPFAGEGNRLGSPTPGISSMSGAFTSTRAATPPSATTQPAKVELDESQPIINLQIRLGGGTRLPARFNPSHTIGDVYSFVAAASPESQIREWVLQTTFPSKELADKSLSLGDMAEFKRGGVVVQTWK